MDSQVFLAQVPASFHATEMCLFDDQGACKVEFDIVGKINDGCWECDGVIKPEFLSACGMVPVPEQPGPALLFVILHCSICSYPGKGSKRES